MELTDEACMARAIEIAKNGWFTARPNPCVGCVIVKDGIIVGEGWHRKAGEAHAETNALSMAGNKSLGATVYVSLEPCNHQGRTPSCAGQLIAAGVKRVVYAVEDPHATAGGGLKTLKEAGIEIAGPLLEADAQVVNEGFLKRCATGLPLVTLKIAASLDGRSAMASGESKWITGSAARRDVQRLRARSGAIITGIGTVLKDDPALTVRAEQLEVTGEQYAVENQPLRVIVDSKFQIRPGLRILAEPGEVLVATAQSDAFLPGAEVISLPNPAGKVSLLHLLEELGARECNDILVEAGAKLAGAFMAEGLVDKLVIYLAAKLLGSRARPMMEMNFDNLGEAIDLEILDVRAIGEDWRVSARPKAN